MLPRSLYLTPRLVRQHLARNRHAICSPRGHHVQWRRAVSSTTSTDSVEGLRLNRRYSAEEDEKIMELRAQNSDWVSMAAALPGRTPRAIKSHYYRQLPVLGVHSVTTTTQNQKRKGKRYTAEDLATLRDMLKRGFRRKAIALELGRSLESVGHHCRLAPSPPVSAPVVTKNWQSWTKAEDDHILRLLAIGLKAEAIARELGRSVGATWARAGRQFPCESVRLRADLGGPGGGLVESSRRTSRKRWTKQEDERIIELSATGNELEQIASDIGRTVVAVYLRWKGVLKHRAKTRSNIDGPSEGFVSSHTKQHQRVTNNVSQLHPHFRRNFTTLHGWEPLLAINPQKQPSALTYSSRRVVGVALWKRLGVFSLPYRPQQRFKHTESTSSSPTKRRRKCPVFRRRNLPVCTVTCSSIPMV